MEGKTTSFIGQLHSHLGLSEAVDIGVGGGVKGAEDETPASALAPNLLPSALLLKL